MRGKRRRGPKMVCLNKERSFTRKLWKLNEDEINKYKQKALLMECDEKNFFQTMRVYNKPSMCFFAQSFILLCWSKNTENTWISVPNLLVLYSKHIYFSYIYFMKNDTWTFKKNQKAALTYPLPSKKLIKKGEISWKGGE